MRIAQLHTPEGIIEVNDEMSDAELAALGVKDKAMLFPEEIDIKEEIKALKKRMDDLEKSKEA